MRKSTRTILALTATISMTAAACGSDSNDSTGDTVTTEAMDESMTTEAMDESMTTEAMDESMTTEAMDESMTTEATDENTEEADPAGFAVDDGASSLRAALTSLLQEHVYLAGIAFETAVDAGGDLEEPATAAAVAALDENTVALADAVGGIVGAEQGDAFLELWRQHIGFFVDYTLGVATENQEQIDTALTNLDGYQEAAGEFFSTNTGGAIDKAELIAGLDEHVATLTAAIDSIVAGNADAFDKLQAAAEHMKGAALLLSSGIVEALPEMFPGDTTSAPAEVRATLTYQLQEHAYLAGIAIEQAIEAGGDLEAPAVQAAVTTLDGNSVALSETVGSVAGDDNAAAFLELWRQHIGFFVDYTLGKATSDQAMVDEALANLDGYQEAAGEFFDSITNGEVAPDQLIPGLDEHVATLTTAIDSLVAGDPAAFSQLRTAGQHMPMAALLLATGIVAATS